MSPRVPALAALALAVLLGGCGLGPGPARGGGAELRVTRDFGQRLLSVEHRRTVRASDTVMRWLEATHKVKTSYGGRFVDSIDGLASTGGAARRDWFYWVNGIEADVGAASWTLSPGDVVQWDYRRWGAAMHIPAIVGEWPEPFVHGLEGKRFPVRLECEEPDGAACDQAQRRLETTGVRIGLAPLGVEAGKGILRVFVGRWRALGRLRDASALTRPPSASGVFARFESDGALEFLDEAGNPARAAPPGTGLVAAVRPEGSEPVWILTGTDDAAVVRAVRALDRRTLADAFAVAVTPAGSVRLPLRGSG